jgi:adenylate kinase
LLDQERLQLTAVINYDLPEAAIVERLAGRRTCSQCKAVYHLTERPPELAGRCDLCQGALFQREDDEPESIRVRLETYKQSTAPLIDFYRKLNLLILVPASGTADEIYVRTMSALSVRPLRS